MTCYLLQYFYKTLIDNSPSFWTMKPISLFLLTVSFSFIVETMIAKYLLVEVDSGNSREGEGGKYGSSSFTLYKDFIASSIWNYRKLFNSLD